MADLTELPENLRNVIADAIGEIDTLSTQMENGVITLSDWQEEMEAVLARFFAAAAMVGAGSDEIGALSQAVASQVNVQLAFLDNFASDIAANGWQSIYNSRAEMYGSAIKQAYWLGETFRQAGGPIPLPAMPAEGTQCLCITTPQSRVFTEYGYVPISEVKVGTLVLTHRMRWKPVTKVLVNQSNSLHNQAVVIAPNGRKVGCTTDHYWFTPSGWQLPVDICSNSYMMYNIPYNILQHQVRRLMCEGDLSVLWQKVYDLPAQWRFSPEILFKGPLPPDTALYDLKVAYDHSFIIEGVISHNSNCKCGWNIDKLDGDGNYNAYWVRNVQDSCQTCIEREARWSPVRIRGGILQ